MNRRTTDRRAVVCATEDPGSTSGRISICPRASGGVVLRSRRIRARWTLPARVRRRGEALLHQQCWYWGCDIRRAEGNLLLEYGFEQFRPPDTERGSTAYRLEVSNGDSSARRLTLWGFGLYYANERHGGGVFLRRYEFEPKLGSEVKLILPMWTIEQLSPELRVPRGREERSRALELVAEACALIERYEHWVTGVCGATYRRACAARFRRAAFRPDEVTAEWGAISDECRRRSDAAPRSATQTSLARNDR